MKKEDLKPCDVVETRKRGLYILLKGDFGGNELAFMDVRTGCYFSFDSYDNNLYNSYGIKKFDIMKVKRFDYSGNAFRALGMVEHHEKREINWDWIRPESYNISRDHRELLWERPEAVEVEEMTLEQVCKELGRTIKIVKG